MDIISQALAKAELILKGVRAKYIIVMPDGETRTHGDLQLAAPVEPKKFAYKVARGTYKNIYGAPIDALAVGDVWQYQCESHKAATEMRAAASAHATKTFGQGNIMSTVSKAGMLEILRLA